MSRAIGTPHRVLNKQLSHLPLRVDVTTAEKREGRLSWKNLEIATRALHRDGLIVLDNLIDDVVLDRLNDRMVEDAHYLESRDDSPFNFNRGNVQQDPPLTEKNFQGDIFINPIITQVTSSVLGPRPRLSFISGNTALPPSPMCRPEAQPTHTDADFDHPESPFALVINIPLIGMSPANGSTEVWLGTHTIVDPEAQKGRTSGCIGQELLKSRRAIRPPVQPTMKKGSVVIRDLRLWHGGMPNLSDEPRVMLALLHFSAWYRNTMKIECSSKLAPQLKEVTHELQVQVQYLPEEEIERQYLSRPSEICYDFDQMERLDDIF